MKPARKIKLAFFLLSFYFIFLPISAYAVTVEIRQWPSSITAEPFEVEVYISGPKPGTNYLRIDLFKEDTKNYFGETFNNNNWYGGSDGTSYLPVEISSEGTASATLRGKVGEPSNTEYSGPGQYKLRIRRYTSSGNAASNDSQEAVNIEIVVPTPTLTPTLTPTPTKTPTPTRTPTPTKVPAAATKNVNTQSPTSQSSQQSPTVTSALKSQQTGSVLGKAAKKEIDIFLPTASPSASSAADLIDLEATVAGKNRKKLSYLFFFLGGVSLIAAAVSAYKIAKNP